MMAKNLWKNQPKINKKETKAYKIRLYTILAEGGSTDMYK
jgi:hypothetical protein